MAFIRLLSIFSYILTSSFPFTGIQKGNFSYKDSIFPISSSFFYNDFIFKKENAVELKNIYQGK